MGKIKVIHETYWRLRLPRRRVSACVEVDTYVLMERTIKILVATGQVLSTESKKIDPEQSKDFTYTIPGCVPPEAAPNPPAPGGGGEQR